MSLRKFFGVPIRLISRSSVQAKIPSLGTLGKKENINLGESVKIPVETDPQRLIEYVCGTNLLAEGGEDVKIKPDSEYPEWLWSIGPPPPLEELDKNSKTYWNRVMRHRRKEENYLRSLRRNFTVHK